MSSECGGDSSVSGTEEVMVDLVRMIRNNIKRTMSRPAHSLVILIVLLTYLGLVTQGSLITSTGLNIAGAEKQKHPRKGKIVAVGFNILFAYLLSKLVGFTIINSFLKNSKHNPLFRWTSDMMNLMTL